jgi:hypothetical protein
MVSSSAKVPIARARQTRRVMIGWREPRRVVQERFLHESRLGQLPAHDGNMPNGKSFRDRLTS